jgi:AcrR family transcriptional regulator
VLRAVERLLDRGERFTTLTVRGICKEAGVARSAFYVNFTDKTDLLLRLVETATGDIVEIAGGWLGSRPALGLESLVAAQEQAISAYRRHSSLLRAYAEVATYDPQIGRVWRERLDGVVQSLVDELIEAQASGDVRPGLDPRVAARFVVFGSEQVLTDHVARDEGQDDRALAYELAQVIWAMLRPAATA